MKSRVFALLRFYCIAVGAIFTFFGIWIFSPLPLLPATTLIVNDRPFPADAIVCLAGGSEQGLPTPEGWQRVATTVRLYRDGFAPLAVFSGGLGTNGRSEARIYAEAAELMGLPEKAARLESQSESTAEHPIHLVDQKEILAAGGKRASLLIVTNTYHGRRTRAVFRKAGFLRVRVVTEYGVLDANAPRRPWRLAAGQGGFQRLQVLILSLREWAALGYYRARGWI